MPSAARAPRHTQLPVPFFVRSFAFPSVVMTDSRAGVVSSCPETTAVISTAETRPASKYLMNEICHRTPVDSALIE